MNNKRAFLDVEKTEEIDEDYLPLKFLQKSNTEESKLKNKRQYAWPCRKCLEVFSTVRELKEHRKVHVTNDSEEHTYKLDEFQDLYICNTCSAEYQEEEEIKKHIKTHEEIYECKVCKEKFEKAYSYAVHIVKHSDDKTFRCPLCSYSTLRRTGLLIHINYVHLKKFYYCCTTCGKGFNDIAIFKEHSNEHLGLRPFICIVCNKDFVYSRNLHTHQIRTHKVGIEGELLPNQCKMCNRIFSKNSTLEKHVQEKHLNNTPHEKRHLCDTCGKGFAQKHKLRLHYRIHTGYKPYSCSYCAKAFTKKDYLVMHERIHSGEKPYSCEFCGRGFTQGAPLRIHLRSHTGERPYVCSICNSGFTSRGALNIHAKNCSGRI